MSKRAVKNHGFQIPSKNDVPNATKWATYIYHMIKEAAPHFLERDDVCEAFNSFTATLTTYSTRMGYDTPKGNAKYHLYHMMITSFIMIPMYSLDLSNAELVENKKKIFNSYIPLYELIKRDIVPYMETKLHTLDKERTIVRYHKYMETIDRGIVSLQTSIKLLEKRIEGERVKLGCCAQNIEDLNQPPILTTFD